ELFTQNINKYKVSILWLTKSLFDHIYLQDGKVFSSLKYLLVGGEALNYYLVKMLSNSPYKPAHFINGYGPTENTTFSCIWSVDKNKLLNTISVPIGKPFANRTAYVLGCHLDVLPVGAIGELYVGGSGLAIGYLNQLQLTKERFIINPFQTEKERQLGINARIYKTGDLVRYLPNGNLEYIGRNDFQIKIRGYRVELSEIENVLLTYPNVEHCIVLSKKSSDTNDNQVLENMYLIAYYIAGVELDETKILAYMSKKLPNYMLPNMFIRIEKLPLTVNGKLDRNALPNPEFVEYVAPRNELEQTICMIYADVLGLSSDKVGIMSDFFRLGGNSILAIKLANKLSSQLNINVAMATLLKCGTIFAMLDHVKFGNTKMPTIPKLALQSNSCYSLSFAQERLWFIDRYESGSNAYNVPLVVEINGKVDLAILKQAVNSIIKRHEILHSLIKTDEFGNSYQKICDLVTEPPIFNEQIVSNKLELHQLINQSVNYIFKLNEEYPIKVSIFSKKTAKFKKNYLCIVFHHIAFDGWSIDVFLNELQSYYEYYYKLGSGKKAILNLPELTIQYKDYAIWQKSYVNNNLLKKQLSYWLKKLDGYQILNLPLDDYRPQYVSYGGDEIPFILNEITSNRLRGLAKNLNVSLYSVLL
ncbi:MAG TPA: condensation domain-containing protein, partial [Aquella sp.]|nr:condensation domain-containing protein [Aquella sp.]